MAWQKYDRTVVLELLVKGWNNHMIAEHIGADVQTIRKIRRDFNIPASTMRRNAASKDEKTIQDKRPVMLSETHYKRTLNRPAYDGNEKCPHCIYRSNLLNRSVCEYITVTKKMRPCKHGSECTEFIDGDSKVPGWYLM